MIILHTNVISALMRPVPETRVIVWLDGLPPESIRTTNICVNGTLATRNRKHFIDTKIPLFNPWEAEPV
jgi:hypothetical protein